mmetsp:Transcript_29831/g.72739  ORF Transcript_29831/g.72739 Transcript_29831/m.72739 type:complete len:157 (+) Transcript_29831:180-650(+)
MILETVLSASLLAYTFATAHPSSSADRCGTSTHDNNGNADSANSEGRDSHHPKYTQGRPGCKRKENRRPGPCFARRRVNFRKNRIMKIRRHLEAGSSIEDLAEVHSSEAARAARRKIIQKIKARARRYTFSVDEDRIYTREPVDPNEQSTKIQKEY